MFDAQSSDRRQVKFCYWTGVAGPFGMLMVRTMAKPRTASQSKDVHDMTHTERLEGFYKAWAAHKRAGFANTQAEADQVARKWLVYPAPRIAEIPAKAPGKKK